MKHQEKVQDALERRVALTPKSTDKFSFRKPGSQNRKKGYRRNSAQRFRR